MTHFLAHVVLQLLPEARSALDAVSLVRIAVSATEIQGRWHVAPLETGSDFQDLLKPGQIFSAVGRDQRNILQPHAASQFGVVEPGFNCDHVSGS